MNIHHQEDIGKLRTLWHSAVEEMKRYEEFYAGREAQLDSNIFYRNSKARAEACFTRISELSHNTVHLII
jgi:hypothetical protein